MRKTTIVDAELGPSTELAAILVAGHACAAIAPWLAGLPAWASAAIAALVLGRGAWLAQRAGWNHAGDVRRFTLDAGGGLVLHRPGGEPSESNCLAVEVLGPWGVILRHRGVGGSEACLLVWHDQCEPSAFRRMRIAARWGAGVAHDERPSAVPFREIA